jgi:hypothetical protein
MSEVIERLAKVIHSAVAQFGEPSLDECRDAARGVLEEMRLPTEEMIAAGRRGLDGNYPCDRDALLTWSDMITVALIDDETSKVA